MYCERIRVVTERGAPTFPRYIECWVKSSIQVVTDGNLETENGLSLDSSNQVRVKRLLVVWWKIEKLCIESFSYDVTEAGNCLVKISFRSRVESKVAKYNWVFTSDILFQTWQKYRQNPSIISLIFQTLLFPLRGFTFRSAVSGNGCCNHSAVLCINH